GRRRSCAGGRGTARGAGRRRRSEFEGGSSVHETGAGECHPGSTRGWAGGGRDRGQRRAGRCTKTELSREGRPIAASVSVCGGAYGGVLADHPHVAGGLRADDGAALVTPAASARGSKARVHVVEAVAGAHRLRTRHGLRPVGRN